MIKNIIITTLLVILLGIFIGCLIPDDKESYENYYSLEDKHAAQGIEYGIETVANGTYTEASFDIKDVKKVYLIGPYSWADDNLTSPYNNKDIMTHWQIGLDKEDRYLLIITTEKSFLPVNLWRKYDYNDFKSLNRTLNKNLSCSHGNSPLVCEADAPLNLKVFKNQSDELEIMIEKSK